MPEDLNRQIGRMKDAWRQEFRQTRGEITRLQRKLDDLRQKLNNADEILATVKADSAGKRTTQGNKYAKLGATDAVRDFFSQHRFTRHNISDVTRHLEREGFQSGSNPRDVVSITCRRLYKERFLDSEVRDGIRLFWVRNKTELLRSEQAGAGKPTPAVQSISI
jgi:uncharacterized protein YukE